MPFVRNEGRAGMHRIAPTLSSMLVRTQPCSSEGSQLRRQSCRPRGLRFRYLVGPKGATTEGKRRFK
eukprot:2481282-Alexandrium_andersonii.AAC.1